MFKNNRDKEREKTYGKLGFNSVVVDNLTTEGDKY